MPSSTGAWANDMPLGSNVATLGQRLQRHGYRTAYVGQWHLDGHDYFGAGESPPGWKPEYWYDGLRYLSDLSAEQRALWRGGLRSAEAIRQAGIGAEFTWAHRSVDRALAFMATAGDAAYLLAVSFDEPHEPFTCPFEYAARFADFDFPVGASVHDSLAGKPETQRRWAAARPVPVREGYRRPLYFGCGSFVDAEIGRLLAGLRASGRDDVWVIFTSDHGEMMGGHRLTGKGPAMYEEITRIPLIVAGPSQLGEARRARQCIRPVSHLDIVPTVLELAGVARPEILAGVSLRPLLARGGNAPAAGAAAPHRPTVHMEFNRFSRDGNKLGGLVPIRAATDGRLKLAINRDDRDELYESGRRPRGARQPHRRSGAGRTPGRAARRHARPHGAGLRPVSRQRVGATALAPRARGGLARRRAGAARRRLVTTVPRLRHRRAVGERVTLPAVHTPIGLRCARATSYCAGDALGPPRRQAAGSDRLDGHNTREIYV